MTVYEIVKSKTLLSENEIEVARDFGLVLGKSLYKAGFTSKIKKSEYEKKKEELFGFVKEITYNFKEEQIGAVVLFAMEFIESK